jgi:hypothetical protein
LVFDGAAGALSASGDSTTAGLKPGQTLHVYAKKGTHVVATKGKLIVAEAPVWLTDQLIERKMVVHDGEYYVVQQTGWIALEAHESAELIYFDAHTGAGAKADSSYQSWAGLGQIFVRLLRFKRPV